jgi:hypothetical protein
MDGMTCILFLLQVRKSYLTQYSKSSFVQLQLLARDNGVKIGDRQ